jgi:hypothetical protein
VLLTALCEIGSSKPKDACQIHVTLLSEAGKVGQSKKKRASS